MPNLECNTCADGNVYNLVVIIIPIIHPKIIKHWTPPTFGVVVPPLI